MGEEDVVSKTESPLCLETQWWMSPMEFYICIKKSKTTMIHLNVSYGTFALHL